MTTSNPMARPVYGDEKRPWTLILCLIVALAVGIIGLPLQVLAYKQLQQTPRTVQIQQGQRTLCTQINNIAVQAGLTPTDCNVIEAEPKDGR